MSYWHPDYARSLAEYGVPRELPGSEGWVLQRPIAGSPYADAMGCYPLFACRNWSGLATDLEDLAPGLVSLSVVADPFGAYDEALLRRNFPDLVRPFKHHFVVDLARPLRSFVSEHHRRNAARALAAVDVELCQQPTEWLDDCVRLYGILVARHDIRGMRAFSRQAFALQLGLPGASVWRAVADGQTVGMTIWYRQGDVGYYHVGCYSELGYQLRASFALFWRAFEHFADSGLRWLTLGAAAGVQARTGDGLARFKRGWSTGTRPAYLCGRVFDEVRLAQIMRARPVPATDYFPPYRQGEFT